MEEWQRQEAIEKETEHDAAAPPMKGPCPQTEAAKRSRFGFLKVTANAVLILLNGFVIALIICLFLAQPGSGDKVKPTIQNFDANSDEYYSENETYQQVNANVHVYQSDGRPDGEEEVRK